MADPHESELPESTAEDTLASGFHMQWAEVPGVRLEGLRALTMDTLDLGEAHPLARALERLLTSGRTLEVSLALVLGVEETVGDHAKVEAWLAKTLPATQPLGAPLGEGRPTRAYALALDMLLHADIAPRDALHVLGRARIQLGDDASLDDILAAVTPRDEDESLCTFDEALTALMAEGLSEPEAAAQAEASFAEHGTDIPIARILEDAFPEKYPLPPTDDSSAHDFDAGRRL